MNGCSCIGKHETWCRFRPGDFNGQVRWRRIPKPWSPYSIEDWTDLQKKMDECKEEPATVKESWDGERWVSL